MIIKRKYEGWLLFTNFIIGIIPASLTIRGFDSWRSIFILPTIFILSIYGFDLLINKITKHLDRKLVLSLTIFLFIILIFNEFKVLKNLEKRNEAYDLSGFHYGARQIIDFYKKNYKYYDNFFITPSISYLPDLYIRFFILDNKKIKIGLPYYFDSNTVFNNSLYALRKEELNNFLSFYKNININIKKIIYYPNGEKAFLIISFYNNKFK